MGFHRGGEGICSQRRLGWQVSQLLTHLCCLGHVTLTYSSLSPPPRKGCSNLPLPQDVCRGRCLNSYGWRDTGVMSAHRKARSNIQEAWEPSIHLELSILAQYPHQIQFFTNFSLSSLSGGICIVFFLRRVARRGEQDLKPSVPDF